jgi:hypothetical protein
MQTELQGRRLAPGRRAGKGEIQRDGGPRQSRPGSQIENVGLTGSNERHRKAQSCANKEPVERAPLAVNRS